MSDLAPASAWDDDLVWPDGSLVDVESIEAWADEARMLASSVLEDGQVRTPDWCECEWGWIGPSYYAEANALRSHEAHVAKVAG